VVHARYGWLKAAGGGNGAIEMGTLPRFLRGATEDFPKAKAYLRPDPAEVERWGMFFAAAPRPLTGLCWRSGSVGGHRAVQFAPLEAWAAFARKLPGSLVCAQYDARDEEIAALKAMCGRDILVPAGIDQKNELDRTAALLSKLDVLASAPTAVSWLAAACGTPTFKILYDTSWTSFAQAYEPFAPSARCMMPRARGDWSDGFDQAETAIKSRFASP
jgi:hypothetical protein